ncbi:MAG TPA: class IV adenylate cyclase [Candidatus Glassbacteria bacterium]|nr:class IV adenylate cyclase [Candidatus Glassbacteria bacterium]
MKKNDEDFLLRHDQTVEIKARCRDADSMRAKILSWGAVLLSRESQSDTFYNVPRGRLKLRRCASEKLLIGYLRQDIGGPKHCEVNLYRYGNPDSLHQVLDGCLGSRVVVNKTRERYLLGNVKFHLDTVEALGDFMEIEVLGRRRKDNLEHLQRTCEKYMELCGVLKEDLVEKAYADLLEELETPPAGSSASPSAEA